MRHSRNCSTICLSTGGIADHQVIGRQHREGSSRTTGSAHSTAWLDRLRAESLFFTNFYATGTVPIAAWRPSPCPCRPRRGGPSSSAWGARADTPAWVASSMPKGTTAFFCTAGAAISIIWECLFSSNGYRVVDQSNVPEESITFKNAWGMCDEDLYGQALLQADVDHAAGGRFLRLMTTSNHRPFTYPAGRIDIPSGYGRGGAVKYADHALGGFLEQAREKPWFGRTIFVVVADHNANSAGKDDLPLAKYHIPLLVYAPGLIPARDVDILSSQIDIAPTVLRAFAHGLRIDFFGFRRAFLVRVAYC